MIALNREFYYKLDRDLAVGDAIIDMFKRAAGKEIGTECCTLICNEKTFKNCEDGAYTNNRYKGHPVIIDNNMEIGETRIRKIRM